MERGGAREGVVVDHSFALQLKWVLTDIHFALIICESSNK